MNNESSIHDIVNSFTLEFWIKPDNNIQSDSPIPASKNYVVDPNCERMIKSGGIMGVSVDSNGIAIYEKCPKYSYTMLEHKVPILEWTHIAIVYNDKTPSLFINGHLVQKAIKSTYKRVYPSDVLRVYSYKGLIDHVRIWDYCRTESQIYSNMFKKLDSNERGLRRIWHRNKEYNANIQITKKQRDVSQENDIKISVIIPSFNQYPFNLLTLKSLEKQTFDSSNMEVIFIDNASTDQTKEEFKDYHPKYHFKYIRCQENVSDAKAREIGQQFSKGLYHIFLNAGTITKPDYVKKQYRLHKKKYG